MKITMCKKQYVYLTLAIMSACLAFTANAFAQTQSEENGRASEKKVENARAVEARDRLQNSMLDEKKQNRLINLVRNTTHRMEAAVLRLENIIERIETRMDILALAGVTSPTAQEYIENAKGKLTEARQQLTEARTLAEQATTSESPRDQFIRAREKFTSIRGSIKDAYTLVRDALALLKQEVQSGGMGTGASNAVRNGDIKSSTHSTGTPSTEDTTSSTTRTQY